jgi:hypothetical protein
MVSRDELLTWINSLDDDAFIGIDEGGLSLVVDGATEYFEIGGMPDEETEQ